MSCNALMGQTRAVTACCWAWPFGSWPFRGPWHAWPLGTLGLQAVERLAFPSAYFSSGIKSKMHVTMLMTIAAQNAAQKLLMYTSTPNMPAHQAAK